MSMIIKSQTGKEVEFNKEETPVMRQLGIDSETMSRKTVIDVLSHGIVYLIANGKQQNVNHTKEVIDELNTWTDDTVAIQY